MSGREVGGGGVVGRDGGGGHLEGRVLNIDWEGEAKWTYRWAFLRLVRVDLEKPYVEIDGLWCELPEQKDVLKSR